MFAKRVAIKRLTSSFLTFVKSLKILNNKEFGKERVILSAQVVTFENHPVQKIIPAQGKDQTNE